MRYLGKRIFSCMQAIFVSMHTLLKTLKLHLQIPILLLLTLLQIVYVSAQSQQLDFEPNDFKMVVTPDHYLIGWYDAQKYGQDFSISSTTAPGVYACGGYCPVAAEQAGAVYYKQFQVEGHGTITVYYDANAKIVGTGRDLDGDGIGDSFDNDADGDGVYDDEDVYPFDPNRMTDLVGIIPGSYQVNSSGSATYNIPIIVPPGTAGIQPSISMGYDSQAGNGLLGIGWSLDGLSSIERCATTLERDGFVDGVDFDTNDQFCMGGQRLIAVSGTYGANDTEYRTEIETFSKIKSYGLAGAGPAYFKVWTKSGEVHEYGMTADSRVEAQGRADVISWAINKISDTSTNYIIFSYSESNTAGEHYISRIDYTGNDNQVMSTYASIRFGYATRPDPIEGYTLGKKYTITQRLVNIKTYIGESWVNDYRLKYDTSFIDISRLSKIGLCVPRNGKTVCLNDTKLTWKSTGKGDGYFETRKVNYLTSSYYAADTKSVTGDFNGDGLYDVVWYVNDVNAKIYTSFAAGNGDYADAIASDLYTSTYYFDSAAKLMVMDVNADNISDLVWVSDNEFTAYAAISNGDGTFSQLVESLAGGMTYHPGYTIASGDFNGDNITDLVWTKSDSMHPKSYTALGKGDGTFASVVYNGFYIQNNTDNFFPALAIDANGDGLTDLVWPGDAANLVYTALSSGDGEFESGIISTVSYGRAHEFDATSGDFNGDDIPDLIWSSQVGAFSTYLVVLGKGDGSFLSGISSSDNIGAGDSLSSAMTADVDGDGMTDMLWAHAHVDAGSQGVYTALAKQDGTFKHAIFSELSQAYGFYGFIPVIADADGDGNVDFLFNKASSTGLINYTFMGERDSKNFKLETVTDGFGGRVKFIYKPLTDSEVYTKGQHASYPEQDIIEPLYVVSKVEADDGIGGTAATTYSYNELKTQLRRHESLGFSKMTAIDNQSGIKSITEFRQDYPFVGLSSRSEMRLSSNQLINDSNLFYASTGGGQAPIFIYVSSNIEQAYDLANGNLLKTTTTASTYDDYGNILNMSITVAGGGQTFVEETKNTYNNNLTNWRLGQIIRAEGKSIASDGTFIIKTTAFEYGSARGLLAKATIEPDSSDVNIKQITSYQYDVYGNRISTTLCDGGVGDCVNGAMGTRTSSTSYVSNSEAYPDGRFPTVTENALGHSESKIYDPRFGAVIKSTVPNGIVTNWEYDSLGRITKERRMDGTQSDVQYILCYLNCLSIGGAQTAYKLVQKATGAAGNVTYFDKLGRELRKEWQGFDGVPVYTDIHYDSRGRILKSSQPYFNGSSGSNILWVTPDYDELGQVNHIKTQKADGTFLHSYINYDGFSATHTDVKGRVKTELKNVKGQTVRVTDAESNNVYFRYDAAGNLKEVEDAMGNLTSFDYDVRGRKIAMNDPDMGARVYQYNAFDEIVSQMDAKNQVTVMTYDALGRLISRTDDATGDAQINTWIYGNSILHNNVGKISAITAPNGSSRAYAYDSYGRLSSMTDTIDGQIYVVRQNYDSVGRVNIITYPATQAYSNGFQVQRLYNDYGYLKKVQSLDSTPVVYWEANQLNAKGQLLSTTLGNGVDTTNVYNQASGLLEAIMSTDNLGGLIYHGTFEYDDIGNLLSRNDHRQNISEDFTYDDLDRLRSSQVIGHSIKSYDYDVLGNLTLKTGVGNYIYNTCDAGPHAVCDAGSNTYQYDANGNMLLGAGRNISYTAFDKVSQITQGVATVSFAYGADKSRVLKVAGNKRTRYIGLGPTGGVLMEQEYDSSTEIAQNAYFIYAADEHPIAQHVVTGMVTYTDYFHRDHLGSIEAVTDGQGVVKMYKSHDAWGKARNPDWTDDPLGVYDPDKSHLRYTGHENIPEVGLINMNGRVYDPDLARFVSADPYVQSPDDTQSYNRYSYVLNNPLSLTDPSGYFFKRLKKRLKSVHKKLSRFHRKTLKLSPSVRIMRATSDTVTKVHFKFHESARERVSFVKDADDYLAENRWAQVVVTAVASYFGGPYGSAAAASHITYAQGGSLEDVQRAGLMSLGMSYISSGLQLNGPASQGAPSLEGLGRYVYHSVTTSAWQGYIGEVVERNTSLSLNQFNAMLFALSLAGTEWLPSRVRVAADGYDINVYGVNNRGLWGLPFDLVDAVLAIQGMPTGTTFQIAAAYRNSNGTIRAHSLGAKDANNMIARGSIDAGLASLYGVPFGVVGLAAHVNFAPGDPVSFGYVNLLFTPTANTGWQGVGHSTGGMYGWTPQIPPVEF